MKKDLKDGAKIFIVGVIIIALVCAIVYFIKLNDNSSANENKIENKKINLMKNDFGGNYGKKIELKYCSTKNKVEDKKEKIYADGFQVDENGEIYNAYKVDNKSYFCEYSYEIGKLYINEKEIKTDKIIKNIASGTNYDEMILEADTEIGEEYNYISTLYILFEDGTLGMIDTNDIKNEKYELTILDEYENEEYFIEVEPIAFGGDINLYVVDINGFAQKVDVIDALD